MSDVSPSPKAPDAEASYDADRQYLGAVYAKALLGTTESVGNTEHVLEELDSLIDDVLATQPQLHAAWSSPRVPKEAKMRMIDMALSGRASREFIHFLKVVANHDRLDCLASIRQAARRQLNDMRGRVAVTIKTAEPASEELVSQVTDRLRQSLGRDLDLTLEVEPDLIGGLLVRIGDTVYDGTVARRLERLRVQAVEAATRQMRQAVERFAVADSSTAASP